MKKYTAVYERDPDNSLIVEIKELPGCHSYGRSLLEARKNVREALELWVDAEVADEQIVEDWSRVVAKPIARQIEEAKVLQAQAARLPLLRKQIAAALVSEGFSTRDAGWLLGVAHQRIHQYSVAASSSRRGTGVAAKGKRKSTGRKVARRKHGRARAA